MCGSLREFGFKVPVLARSDGEVVDGHLRLKAARKLGSWPGGDTNAIPVILCDEWSDAQVFLSTVAYADRSILSISGSGIKDEFGLTPSSSRNFILSAFSWAYVLGQIRAGCCSTVSERSDLLAPALVVWS